MSSSSDCCRATTGTRTVTGRSGTAAIISCRSSCLRRLTLPVLDGDIALGTWQSVVVVDPNRENNTRRLRLSFVPA